eukprot:1156372-Pelagomonas_calceolata.AAC.9
MRVAQSAPASHCSLAALSQSSAGFAPELPCFHNRAGVHARTAESTAERAPCKLHRLQPLGRRMFQGVLIDPVPSGAAPWAWSGRASPTCTQLPNFERAAQSFSPAAQSATKICNPL